ncbi:aminotransferase class I/II-fold pyridoxal phosphate-dependent enzyme [Pedobacter duraquae]|uniref:7-keto-8-aminopelargonate synthetase-like enzyme n=1 Tax=Pedobacter duraquae TaxID=425511 RepID=A0A4R6ICJ1_9SPHI|nr:aminotransferase class I/II-fold pyridoxal phosphate-dependent enzyme [Pedobacter duraquae]TDO19218.1 7-keto-8-aminopelargonate synthetase-like enzyme [Pedobacter duraquae]
MKNIEQLSHLPGALSATITVGNATYLYFGGTAYLGIPQNVAFLQHYVRGLSLFGLNNGTSRNNNVQLNIYNEAEDYAAGYFKAEAALITSSGYLAAQMAAQYAATLGQIAYAPATHPALWLDGNPGIEGSFTAWGERISTEINQSDVQDWVLISNSINNLFPEVYDFGFLSRLKPGKRVTLLIDDSHGIGILNNGIGAQRVISGVDVIYVASMAKGPGVDAGLILGSSAHISALKQTPQFPGASPPTAAGLYAFMQGSAIYREEHDQLCDLQYHMMNQGLVQDNFEYIPEFPVFLHRDSGLADRLLQQRILISAFPYPDSNGPRINRIVLSSWHTQFQLDTLIQVLAKAIRA